MWPLEKSIDAITEDDLQRLIPDVREGLRLDYKEKYGWKPGDRREILKDVSSFANTAGGYLIVGMTENKQAADGTPGELVGIENGADFVDRVVKLCQSSLDPPIVGLRVVDISLKSPGRSAVVMFVPASAQRPHMVDFDGHHTFYSRHEHQSRVMITHEVRHTVLAAHDADLKLREFLKERHCEVIDSVNDIASEGDLAWVQPGPGVYGTNSGLCWAYAVPMFLQPERIEVIREETYDFLGQPPQQGSFDGMRCTSETDVRPTLRGIERMGRHDRSFLLLRMHREGFIDFSKSGIWHHDRKRRMLKTNSVAKLLCWWTRVAYEFSRHFLDGETLLVGVSLDGVKDTLIPIQDDRSHSGRRFSPHRSSQIVVPPLRLTLEKEYREAGKRLTDRLYNSYGIERSWDFGEDGGLLSQPSTDPARHQVSTIDW